MLRKRIVQKLYLTTLIVFLLFTISGFTWNKDLPNIKIEYQTNLKNIYLLNSDSYLVEVGILVDDDLLKSIPIIVNSLKNSSKYYNGLRGLLPNNTEINSVNIENDILMIDFNKELLNVNENIEEKVIESLVFSLLNFKDLKGIKISIDGNSLTCLPKSKIKLDDVLTKKFGINKEYSITSTKDINRVVLYYYQEIGKSNYYVPITRYVNNKDDKIKIIIDNLKNSYLYKTNLMSYLNEKVNLLSYEQKDHMVTLSFDKVNDFSQEIIEEELIYTMSNSIFLSSDIERVIFMVNDKIFTIKTK